MTTALKRHLAPVLMTAGFAGTFPRYRRLGPDSIHFLLVAYDKEATAFFLEFGAHPRGELQTSWGELVPEDKLLLEHVPFQQRARLQARCGGGSMPQQWFQFGSFAADESAYAMLALHVSKLLPQLESWLASAAVGPNVAPNGR